MASPTSSTFARNAALARNALQPGGPDGMASARGAVLRKFEEAVEAVQAGLPLDERRKRALRLRSAWLGSIGVQAANKRHGRPFRTFELDSWLAARVAVATKNGTGSEGNEPIPSEERGYGTAPSPEEERRVGDVLG